MTIKNSWLKNVYQKLTASKVRSTKRPGLSALTTFVATIQELESRQLLTTPVPVGAETQVNTFTTGHQSQPVVAMDSSGDYVVAWQSAGQDGSLSGVYAQRFNALGTALGSEFRVNSTTTGDQTSPSIAMDSSGDFVIVWISAGQDGSGAGIYSQRFDATGVPQGGEFLVNTYTTGDQITPAVAMDATGDFVVAWDSIGQYTNSYLNSIGSDNVYAQRYNSSGVAQGSEFKVNSLTSSSARTPAVAMDAAGDFVIAWERNDFNNSSDPWSKISAKKYDSTGTVTQSDFLVATGGTDGQHNPSVAIDTSGDVLVAYWGYYDDGLDNGVRAVNYAPNGSINSSFQVNLTIQRAQDFPKVAYNDGGNNSFVITWQSVGQDGSGIGVYVNQGGFTGESRVNSYTTGSQSAPAIAADSKGDYVIVWDSANQDGSGDGIYSQQFLAARTPLLVHVEGTTLNAIGQQYTPITSTMTAYDAVNNTWTGATIAITGNYQNGEDVLGFTNTYNISGTFNATTGVMRLTGTATVSEYLQAIRSVTYHNTSGTPNTAVTRTVTMQARYGLSLTNVVTRDLTVVPVSNPPTVTGLDASTTFPTPSAPLILAPNLVVADPDGFNIQSASVTFFNAQGGDRLSFHDIYAFPYTFVQDLSAHTATLTITGVGTPAQYQTLLRSVTYQDVAGNPNLTPNRAVTFTVNDKIHSGSATTNFTEVRYVSGLGPSVNYTQGNAPQVLAPTVVITPPPGRNIQSATVTFTNWQAEDRLAFYNSLALQHTFTQDLAAHTATLTLTGTASAAGYQTLLRSVTYQDVAGVVNRTNRIAKITVYDGTNTASATENVTITSRYRPPVVQVNNSTPSSYTMFTTPVPILNQVLISDADSNNLTSLTVQITSGYEMGQDILTFVNQLGITSSFNAATGTLKLSGSSYVGNYREALRTVTYRNYDGGTHPKTLTFTIIATDDTNTPSDPVTRNLIIVQDPHIPQW